MKHAAVLGIWVVLLLVGAAAFQDALEVRVGRLETQVAYHSQFIPTATSTATSTPSATPTTIPMAATNIPNTPTQEFASTATPQGVLGAGIADVEVLNIRASCGISARKVGQYRRGQAVLVVKTWAEKKDGYIWLPIADYKTGYCVAWQRIDGAGKVLEEYIRFR